MNEKILVVDDEKEIADLLEVYLNIKAKLFQLRNYLKISGKKNI